MTEIEIDKIIDYFLKNSKPIGKPYVWVDEEVKEEIRGILNENSKRNKGKIDIFKNKYSRHFSNFSNGNKTFY